MTKIYFTQLAYLQLLIEVKKYTLVETGAILVGRVINDNFYVFESLDSGINCRRSSSIFYRDNPYSEHLVDVVRAKYNGAVAIGFWHRHPGNFNKFSHDDMDANIDMARVLGRNIISGLVNVFNGKVNFRFWQISLDNRYDEAEIIVNDNAFRGVLGYKDIHSIEKDIVEKELGGRQDYFSQMTTVVPISSTSHIIKQPIQNEIQCQEPRSINEINEQEKQPKKWSRFNFWKKKLNRTSAKRRIQSEVQETNRQPIIQVPIGRSVSQIKTDDTIESCILLEITGDLEMLQNRYHIYCEKWRMPEGAVYRDKLALNFKNVTNGKSCSTLFYYKENNLYYYLDVVKQDFLYVRSEFMSNLIKNLEDINNGNR